MLLLLFHVKNDLYAIDTAHIIEIIPMVMLRVVRQVPHYVAGVFNYHGEIIPVIDLNLLIQGTAARSRFSTRIVIVRSQQDSRYLGLIAEQVTETLNRPDLFREPAIDVKSASYLGEMLIDERGMIQLLHWQRLIPEIQQALNASSIEMGNGDRNRIMNK